MSEAPLCSGDWPEPRHSDRVLLVRAQVRGACGAGICVSMKWSARRVPCSYVRRAMQKYKEDTMRTILLATCTAVVTAVGAFGASAAQLTPSPTGDSGAVIRVEDRYYYNNNDGDYQYPYQDYYNNRDQYPNYDYRTAPIIPPRSIARHLARADYHDISRPVLSGRVYQVKATNPNGHRVKLYIDAYSGQILRVKG